MRQHSTYINPNIANQPAAYVIYKDNTSYYAKEGLTGTVIYTDTDAASVINDALAGASHGQIIMRTGIYDITDRLTIPDNGISLVGEGRNTILNVANGVNDTAIYSTGNDDVCVSNFTLNCNKANQNAGNGVQIMEGDRTSIFDMRITNAFASGIEVRGRHLGIYDNVIEDGGGAGVTLASLGVLLDGINGYNVKMSGNTVTGCLRGLDAGPWEYSMVSGNTFDNCTATDYAIIAGINYSTFTGNVINNCKGGGTCAGVGVTFGDLVVGNNVFSECSTGVKVVTGAFSMDSAISNNLFIAVNTPIAVSAGVLRTVVTNNIWRGCGANVVDGGIDTFVHNNVDKTGAWVP